MKALRQPAGRDVSEAGAASRCGDAAANGGPAAQAPPPDPARSDAVRRYVAAASAARTADEGMAPALALLVAAAGRDPAFAGVLLAAAGLPHVVAGPVAGALLDAARHRRAILALAPLTFGLVLAATTLALGRAPDAASVALVAVAGCAGPLLTGGLSAELTQIVGARPERALALDGATYNLAAIAGPGAVAAVAALFGAGVAALSLAALALGGALAVLRLPASPRAGGHGQGLRASLGGARRLWAARPLRLVTAGTTLAFAGAGALPLLAIARADELGASAAGAGVLAAMAAGALVGALVTAAAGGGGWRRVFRGGAAERRVAGALLAVAFGLAVAGAGPGMAALGAGLVVAGLADGILLPAILAVRTAHSRPEERGAVFTTAASVKVAAGAAGAGLGGVLLTATGAATALLVAAGLHVLGALVCLRYRSPS